MPQIFITEDVDIYQRPALDEAYAVVDGEITLGDLHANAMKLIFVLVKHGIITDISEAQYAELVNIYCTPVQELPAKLDRFEAILDEVTWKPTVLVRLIGDVFCDRGMNEDFIFTIIKKMSEKNIRHEELWGNHDADLIEATETTQAIKDFGPPMLRREVAGSMYAFATLLQQMPDRYERALDIVKTAYKPHLKLLSYTLDKDNNKITLYSHAAIDLVDLQYTAEKLGVPYRDSTVSELAMTIDDIQAAFAVYVEENRVHTLYTYSEMLVGYVGKKLLDSRTSPFEKIAWNRFYDELNRAPEHNGYAIHYVHGHDSRDPDATAEHITNLDNMLGKSSQHNEGEYTALYSVPNTLQKQLSASLSDLAESGKRSKIGSALRNIASESGLEDLADSVDFANFDPHEFFRDHVMMDGNVYPPQPQSSSVVDASSSIAPEERHPLDSSGWDVWPKSQADELDLSKTVFYSRRSMLEETTSFDDLSASQLFASQFAVDEAGAEPDPMSSPSPSDDALSKETEWYVCPSDQQPDLSASCLHAYERQLSSSSSSNSSEPDSSEPDLSSTIPNGNELDGDVWPRPSQDESFDLGASVFDYRGPSFFSSLFVSQLSLSQLRVDESLVDSEEGAEKQHPASPQ